MSICVIIPVYNAERFLARTVDSVLAQTYLDWKLILIDDGSQDKSAQIAHQFAEKDSRIRVVVQENAGVAAARNRGIAEMQADVEFVAFLDHDDVWRPETLAILTRALEGHPEAVGAHGLTLPVPASVENSMFVTEGVPAQRYRRKVVRRWGMTRVVSCDLAEPTTFEVQIYDGPVSTPGQMLARRSAVEQVGAFDASTTPCDDWDFWARMSLLGPAVFVDQIVLNWRSHGGNASASKAFMGHGVSQIRRAMLSYPGITAQQRTMAHWRYRRMYASVERHNAQDSLRWAWEALIKGNTKDAARWLPTALRLYSRYAALSWVWGKTLDRGPIPDRLEDLRLPTVELPGSRSNAQ